MGDPLIVKSGPHVEEIKNRLNDLRARLVRRCRSKLPGTRWRGAFEIDFMHKAQAQPGSHKAAFLKSAGIDVDKIAASERICLPHLHAVVDIRDFASERFAEELRGEFQGPWRILCRPLHDDKSVRENLTILAGYVTKLKAAYSEWSPETATRFMSRYEDHWRKAFESNLLGIGLNALSLRYGGL